MAADRDASSEMTRQRDAVSIEREHTAHTGPTQSSPPCSQRGPPAIELDVRPPLARLTQPCLEA
jgi:hypothetical protein